MQTSAKIRHQKELADSLILVEFERDHKTGDTDLLTVHRRVHIC